MPNGTKSQLAELLKLPPREGDRLAYEQRLPGYDTPKGDLAEAVAMNGWGDTIKHQLDIAKTLGTKSFFFDALKALNDVDALVVAAIKKVNEVKAQILSNKQQMQAAVATASLMTEELTPTLTGLIKTFTEASTALSKIESGQDYNAVLGAQATLKDAAEKLAAEKSEYDRQADALKTWGELAGDYSDVKLKVGELKGFAAVEEPQFTLDLAAIQSQADLKNFPDAVSNLKLLKPKVLEVRADFPGRKNWEDAKTKHDGGMTKTLTQLKALERPVAEALQQQRDAIDVTVTGKKFDDAVLALSTLQQQVGVVYAAFVHHTAGMNELGPRLVLANKAVADTTVDSGTKKTEYETAVTKEKDSRTLAKYTDLPASLTALKAKAEALVAHYQANGTGVAHDTWLDERLAQVKLQGKSLVYKAGVVPLKTPKIAKLREEVEDLWGDAEGTDGDAVPDQIAAWEALVVKGLELLAARDTLAGGTGKAEAALYKKYRAIEKHVTEAEKEIKKKSTPLPEADQKFKATMVKFRDFWEKDKNYEEAAKLLPTVKSEAEAVLKPLVESAKLALEEIGNLPATNTTEKNAKSDKTREQVNTKLSPFQLESLGAEGQVKLLEALRVDGNIGTNTDSRTAQKNVYRVMKFDDKFLEVEAEKRKEMNAALLKDQKEFLLEAKSRWGKKPANSTEAAELLAEKKKVLEMVAKAQCEAFGYNEPPPIEFVDEPDELDNGGFNPGDKKIRLNKNSVALNDFEAAIDLLVHENHHNYQDQLVARLRLPSSDPNQLKPSDPLYAQAQMFAINFPPPGGAYVPGSEGQADYEKQPIEEHAWYSGPKTARGLVKGLNA